MSCLWFGSGVITLGYQKPAFWVRVPSLLWPKVINCYPCSWNTCLKIFFCLHLSTPNCGFCGGWLWIISGNWCFNSSPWSRENCLCSQVYVTCGGLFPEHVYFCSRLHRGLWLFGHGLDIPVLMHQILRALWSVYNYGHERTQCILSGGNKQPSGNTRNNELGKQEETTLGNHRNAWLNFQKNSKILQTLHDQINPWLLSVFFSFNAHFGSQFFLTELFKKKYRWKRLQLKCPWWLNASPPAPPSPLFPSPPLKRP